MDPPPEGIVLVYGITQESEGSVYHLRGKAKVESTDYLIEADEIDYNEATGIAEARGHAHFINFDGGEELYAERIDYNYKNDTGTFYKVEGSLKGKIEPRPGVMITESPFHIQGEWAERYKDQYFLYKGVVTDCRMPKPWWTLTAPKFDIIPGDRALAYKSIFKLRGIPLLYAPVFYRALNDEPRHSGFLTPNIGSSSKRGFMFGVGYYWAINRSYDLLLRPVWFTKRGLAYTIDFRGKPTQKSDFDVYVYGVNDKGLVQPDGSVLKQGGYIIAATGKTDIGKGFYARANINYLSSFEFRQAFTESFNEAVFSEVNSVAYVAKNWSTYNFDVVFADLENFQSTTPGDKISIRALPQVEFNSRAREINEKILPVWVSWDTTAGLMSRSQPLFQTRNAVERIFAQPQIMTALRWKDITLFPAFSIREAYYGSSLKPVEPVESAPNVQGANLNELSYQFTADLELPSLSKIYNGPKWMGGKVKHTIEPLASFKLVNGIQDFRQIIRFDQTEIYTDTAEVRYGVTSRLWTKSGQNQMWDWMTFDIEQKRFFNPTFGGAVVSGQRNVFTSSIDLTGFAFIAEPRTYSPIVTDVRLTPKPSFNIEWRADYDPLRGKLVNSSLTADARHESYFLSFGHSRVACVPLGLSENLPPEVCNNLSNETRVLAPPSNQLRAMVGLGNENRKGWNAGVLTIYDYSLNTLQYANTQVTYNTDCCAFSGQYRRFNFGTRRENQWRFALVVANIGSFGTLRRQERLF
jgi:LPS-assembly protein